MGRRKEECTEGKNDGTKKRNEACTGLEGEEMQEGGATRSDGGEECNEEQYMEGRRRKRKEEKELIYEEDINKGINTYEGKELGKERMTE